MNTSVLVLVFKVNQQGVLENNPGPGLWAQVTTNQQGYKPSEKIEALVDSQGIAAPHHKSNYCAEVSHSGLRD